MRNHSDPTPVLVALGVIAFCLVGQFSGTAFPGGIIGGIGVVLVLLGLVISLRRGSAREGLIRGVFVPGPGSGSVAIATILSAHDTGGRGGANPRVRFELFVRRVDGDSFVATTVFHVSGTGPFSLSDLRPGAMVAVRTGAGARPRVSIARSLSPLHAQWALDEIRLREGEIERERLDVVREGVETRALVVSCVPTGEIVGDHPWMMLGLRVYRDDTAWFPAEVRVAVPLAVIPRLQDGAELAAFYVPEDEANVTIVLPVITAGIGILMYA